MGVTVVHQGRPLDSNAWARPGGADSPSLGFPGRGQWTSPDSGQQRRPGRTPISLNPAERESLVSARGRWLRLVSHPAWRVSGLSAGDLGEEWVIDEHPHPVALEYRWSFGPELAVSGRARQLLAPILEVWGMSGQQCEDALLVMNELVANSVEHARTPLELLVSFTGASVLIEVRDAAVAEPQLQPFDRTTRRGRGLQFVDALAHRWSWTLDGDGKVVWAEMAIGDSEGPSPD
ncbi:MAG TPA: ATP-binding protein [Actinophytocola sp.]|nr:ATP-binding protein [Actinophytocola sp.]